MLAATIACPRCRTSLTLAGTPAADQKLTCPKCRTTFAASQNPSHRQSTSSVRADTQGGGSRPRTQPGSPAGFGQNAQPAKSKAGAIAIVAAVLLLLGGGIPAIILIT